MENDPDAILFIRAHFDEVIPCAKGAELPVGVLGEGAGMLSYDDRVLSGEFVGPHFGNVLGSLGPCANVPSGSVFRPSMGNGQFDRRAHFRKIAQLLPPELGAHGHHPATDIHSHRRRYDRVLRWQHRSHRRSHSPVCVRHGSHPLKDEGELRCVPKLLDGFVLELHAFAPRLDDAVISGFNDFEVRH